ncbi:hypothetical protein JL722_10501 [Aureococcus anophagefferens]|nr:hypothetical protein JL722_10501 [Aureococcus anophagefferens]
MVFLALLAGARALRPAARPRSLARGLATRRPAAYDVAEVEARWQARWDDEKTFASERREGREKKYVLDMFPYPSGSGLHVGHPEGYTATDIMSRYWRMRGYDVLHPMGWDAFGLPAEQHAINTGTHPRETTLTNIGTFKRQLKSLGLSYDWDRGAWIFLQLFKVGLAEQKEVPVNWCPALGTVLANEEIIDGLSERGSHPVVRAPLRQWVLKITDYADKLLDGLDDLDWPAGTLRSQREWIGRSEGAAVKFRVQGLEDETVEVFTTRPDTLMGATYVCLAPEHPLVARLSDSNREAVDAYVAAAARKSDLDRTATSEKTGVPTGSSVVHPLTGEALPLWVADYVLGAYGTGAVMAVPAHDARDFAFAAEAFDLPVKVVVESKAGAEDELPFVGSGVAVNSGEKYDGLKTAKAKKAVTYDLDQQDAGGTQVTYKLRDWVFSRQRYWGEPIPITFPVLDGDGAPLQADGAVDPRTAADEAFVVDYANPAPVPEGELPLELPETDDYAPGDDPAGCLARVKDWRFYWAGSCWYYMRYADNANDEKMIGDAADKSWLPVDLYVGGAEHAVLHLLYARFWHKVLYDIGATTHEEPFAKLVHQGLILGSDGEKMSKRPRTRRRSLDQETDALLHKTMRKVTGDIDALGFNTAISALMVLATKLSGLETPPADACEKLALMVSPFAPHLGEECWRLLGHAESLAYAPWVEWDEAKCVDATVTMAVQVNGKVRATIELAPDAPEDEARALGLGDAAVAKFTDGKDIKKVIYVPGKILNVVVAK